VQGVGEWATTSKGVCSKCAIAACCVRAGSARTPTTHLRLGAGLPFRRRHDRRRRCDGRTIAIVSHIPGNVLNAISGSRSISTRGLRSAAGGAAQCLWRQARRPRCRAGQADRRGGFVERAPIRFDVNEGGARCRSAGQPCRSRALQGSGRFDDDISNTIFSTVPGAPVFVARRPATARTTRSSATISSWRGITPCKAPLSSTADR